MSGLSIQLFGRLTVRHDELVLDGPSAQKAQELLAYLAIHRARAHPREALAALLWPDVTTAQSKKYLRQALWQLHSAIQPDSSSKSTRPLLIDGDTVRFHPVHPVFVDVAMLEDAHALVRDRPAEGLNGAQAQALRSAADLYGGDLLEGWYHDWCLYERERLQNMYLSLLDKLMAYCERERQYETAIGYGTRILRCDGARESAHRRLMRLHFLAGDRPAALRQYERCAAVLSQEFGVTPASPTVALREQILAGQLEGTRNAAPATSPAPSRGAQLSEVLSRLQQMGELLTQVQRQVQQDMRLVERALKPERQVR